MDHCLTIVMHVMKQLHSLAIPSFECFFWERWTFIHTSVYRELFCFIFYFYFCFVSFYICSSTTRRDFFYRCEFIPISRVIKQFHSERRTRGANGVEPGAANGGGGRRANVRRDRNGGRSTMWLRRAPPYAYILFPPLRPLRVAAVRSGGGNETKTIPN